MDAAIGWIVLTGLCFAVYVVARLSSLTAEVRGVKGQVAHLSRHEFWSAGPARPAQPSPQPLPPIDFVVESAGQVPAPLVIVPPLAAPPAAASADWTNSPGPPRPQVVIAPRPPKPGANQATPAQPLDIESVVGANWMAKLGIAAIAVSVAFFLQYAFRNGWIKPWGQVGIGLCGAVAMMGAGQLLLTKEQYRSYAQVLFSGGVVVYFLSIYAAYSFYQPPLTGYGSAFCALAIGAIAGSALALANGTEAVAVICILGAFAAPALIREHGGTPSPDGLLKLYVYLAAINLWAAAFIRFRAWYSVAVSAFMCTWILFLAAGPVAHGGWRVESFAILFLLSAVWTGVKALCCQPDSGEAGSPRMAGVAVIIAACLAFVLTSAAILADSSSFGFPDFAIIGTGIGLLLAALSVALPETGRDDTAIRRGFAILSSVASGGVMAVAFLSAPPTAPGQVAPAFVFAVLNYAVFIAMALWMRKRDNGGEPAALLAGVNAAVHILVTLHILAATQVAGVPAACLWLPVAALLTLGAVWLGTQEEDAPMLLPATLCAAALAFILAALLRAVGPGEWQFKAHWPAAASWMLAGEFLLLSAAWTALRHRIAWREARMDVIGTLANAAVFFAMMACAVGAQRVHGLSILAAWSLTLAVWHGLVAMALFADARADDLLRYSFLGTAITFLTIAIPLQLETGWVTGAWAAEAVALVWAGVAAGSSVARRFGYAVLAIAASRPLLVDLVSSVDPFRFLFNARTSAGASVAGAACVCALLLWSRRDSLERDERELPGALTLLANLFTLLFLSVDLWQQFGGETSGVISAQQLALSIFWALYGLVAICVGIGCRNKPVRLCAVALLYFAIFKVFLYDLRQLETPYRIASFFTLGVVFLLASYLYTRFEERMHDDGPGRAIPPTPPQPGAVT